jgi:hypothetical protein
MNKTEYVILSDEHRSLTSKRDLHDARALAEEYAKESPGKEYFIATITHRIKAIIKTEWDE